MKNKRLIAVAFALAACLSCGLMFGCSNGGDGGSGQGSATSGYDQMIQKNTIEALLGENGTLSCTVEEYDEDSVQTSNEQWEWSAENGSYSVKWSSTDEDGLVQLAQSQESQEGCGAIYMVENTEDNQAELTANVYPQGNFQKDVTDQWLTIIDNPGEETESTTEGDSTITTYKEQIEDDADYYYVCQYTTNTQTGVIQALEMTEYQVEDDVVVYKMVVKDVNVGGTVDLGSNPYETISGVADSDACNVTIHATNPDGTTVTSTYKVSHQTDMQLAIWDDYAIYTDEAMTEVVEEIDVSGAEAVVYVKITEASEDEGTVEGEGEGEDADGADADADSEDADIDLGEDELGTQYVSENGDVITLGEDGQYYDEDGNLVVIDEEDIER